MAEARQAVGFRLGKIFLPDFWQTSWIVLEFSKIYSHLSKHCHAILILYAGALSAILIDGFSEIDFLVFWQNWWVPLPFNETWWVPRNPGTPFDKVAEYVSKCVNYEHWKYVGLTQNEIVIWKESRIFTISSWHLVKITLEDFEEFTKR